MSDSGSASPNGEDEQKEWSVSFTASRSFDIEASDPREAREKAKKELESGNMQVHESSVTDDAGVWLQFNGLGNIEDSMGWDDE